MQVTLEEARFILAELYKVAESGLEVVITKDGQPYMSLAACRPMADSKGQNLKSRSELRQQLPSDSFGPLPGWDEPLGSLFDSDLNS